MFKNILLGGIVPLILVATGVAVVVGMKKPDPQKVPPLGKDLASRMSVLPAADVQRVHALAEKSETLDIPVSGTVVPYREIQLAAEAAGRITEKDLNVRSGNFVTEGQILYRIDPRDYELEVQRLTRRLEQERAALKELVQDIANSKRLLEVAEEELKLAEADVRRFESLNANFSSASELDEARRSRLTSMNQKVNAQNQVRTFETRSSRLELAINLAETELKQAELDLQRTTIRAPVDGRIVSEEVEADSYVQRGTPLVVIEDTGKVEVACNLRMDQLYWILDQQDLSADQLVNAALASRYELPPTPVKVRFELAGRESILYEWDGTLSRYDGAGLDPQSRTVPIRVLVDRPGEFQVNGKPVGESDRSGPPTLVRGMFVEVIVKARPATQLLLVPKLGIKPATNMHRIWKFVPDPSALDASRKVKQGGASDDADDPTDSADTKPVASRKVDIDPAEWEAGFLRVISDVEVVGAFREPFSAGGLKSEGRRTDLPAVEYWTCEVPGGQLSAGDHVVVTPLPGIEAEGDEAIRVPRQQLIQKVNQDR